MVEIKDRQGIHIGDKFRHYKGDVYEITGFSTLSIDGAYDGAPLIHYSNEKRESFSTPISRFISYVRRFTSDPGADPPLDYGSFPPPDDAT